MKTVIYITKNKVWAGGQVYSWDGENLEEIFGRIRRDQKVSEARVVLGNDVSFVTSMKFTEAVLDRESVLRAARLWMPFQIDDGCFDWKEVAIVPGEKWLQLVATEKVFLEQLSLAAKKNSIKIDLVTTIGIILAEKTHGREVPVIVKWTGRENLLVVAVNGLADLVAGDISEEDLMLYAKQKWGLAVNPEELMYTEADMDVVGSVFAEKNRGNDRMILNLPILKEAMVEKEKEEEGESVGSEDKWENTVEEKTKKKAPNLVFYLIVLVIAALSCGGLLYKMGFLATILPQTAKPVTPTTTVSPMVTATPTLEAVDLSKYTAQVLNGSGVVGEAAKIKAILLKEGVINVDIGNTTATTESQIRLKEMVPNTVGEKLIKDIEDNTLTNGTFLMPDNKYDLVIILGKH